MYFLCHRQHIFSGTYVIHYYDQNYIRKILISFDIYVQEKIALLLLFYCSKILKNLYFIFFRAGNPAKYIFYMEKYTCHEGIMNCHIFMHNYASDSVNVCLKCVFKFLHHSACFSTVSDKFTCSFFVFSVRKILS